MFTLDPLPYAPNALEPFISARTLEFHYGKHHRGYVDKLNEKIASDGPHGRDLESLVRHSTGDLFNLAAQVWNHSFYWESMKPGGGGEPGEALSIALETAFGSVEDFRREFAEAAKGEFGSGWAWLVRDKYGRLQVQNSSDAENPMQRDYEPILTIDVWEHAYYLDYQNERGRYVTAFLDHLVDWERVADRLQISSASGADADAEFDGDRGARTQDAEASEAAAGAAGR